jgi:hypothetical protein
MKEAEGDSFEYFLTEVTDDRELQIDSSGQNERVGVSTHQHTEDEF